MTNKKSTFPEEIWKYIPIIIMIAYLIYVLPYLSFVNMLQSKKHIVWYRQRSILPSVRVATDCTLEKARKIAGEDCQLFSVEEYY